MSYTHVVIRVPDKTRVRWPKAHNVTLMLTSVCPRSSLARSSQLPIFITRPLTAEIGVRFMDLRKGSHLPIRTQARPHPPAALKPVAKYPSITKSFSQPLSPLVERREARQARSRPWMQPFKQVAPRRTQIQALPVVTGLKAIPIGVTDLEHSVAANLVRRRPIKSALGIAPPKSGPASVGRTVVADMKNVEMKSPSLTENSGDATTHPPKKHVSFGDIRVSEFSRWIEPEFVYSPGIEKEMHDMVPDTSGCRYSESALLLPNDCPEYLSGCRLKPSRRLSALNAHIKGQCVNKGNCSWHWVATHRKYFPDEPSANSFRLMSNIRRNISGV